MKIGVVQACNVSGKDYIDTNRRTNGQAIEALFADGAKIIVLPECANHQYVMRSRDEADAFAEELDGPSVAYWQRLASVYGGYIAGGILEREGSTLYNTAVLVGPNGPVGHYRKVHLFDWEKEYLSPGNVGFQTFLIEKLKTTVSMLVCYDLRFPEAVRSVALGGCDVLLVPTTWTSIGKSVLWDERGYCLANYLAVAHTYSNRMAIVCADRAGKERDVRYMGASLIVDSMSRVVAGPASKYDADCLLADVDVSLSRDKRVGKRNDLLKDRRPEHYKLNG
ncbi:nitrilase-related carbon-nitrogen hydrolase [Aneurinibacillus sp. UBA3580]|jgi:predicted amidohydrolase|uniref:nitrilase-related carbon-nitrogen hydrolase n=1 Tax=Aneurinibacillus sp. UBA3580 TaxID=1946041 RepID=UPI00257BFB22|nr:nitrilase-related carbon-nitrogen hydrolase [Aneurinibacillus sp. UBA3580]